MSARIGDRVCTECKKKRQLRFYDTLRSRVCVTCKQKKRREHARKSHLGKRYEITPEEYARLEKAKAGRCWLCGGKRPYKLHVDHDHELEKLNGVRASVRGLLCRRCNKLLRDVGDDLEVLAQARDYLITAWQRAQKLLGKPD